MIPTAALSSVAFCAPFVAVLICALVLIIEERREARLHRRMARDLARPRVGIDAHHFTHRTPSGGAVPLPPSAERPFDQQEPRR